MPSLHRPILIFVALLFSTSATLAGGKASQCHTADDRPDCYLVVWKTSGERVAFSFIEHPTVKQRGEQLVVETTNAELLFPLHAVLRFTLADRLGEGQAINAPYYDVNNDGRVTVVDVAQLISRLERSVSPYQIDAAIEAILRKKR